MADSLLAAWAGVFVGAVLATLWPYFNVRRSRPGTPFDWMYIGSLVLSILIAMPTAQASYALIAGWVQVNAPLFLGYLEDPWFVFALGIMVGVLVNRAGNEFVVDKGRSNGQAQGGGGQTPGG